MVIRQNLAGCCEKASIRDIVARRGGYIYCMPSLLDTDLWVIPDNIHTLPWVASWNSKGGGVLGLKF